MPDQLSLTGFDPATQRTDALFFAVYPDAQAAAHITRLRSKLIREHGLKGAPIVVPRLHVTLHYLGGFAGLPRQVVVQASEAAAGLAVAPFELRFDCVKSFRSGVRGSPFVLCGTEGMAALVAFQRTLGAAMTERGLGQWVTPRFTPHLTLLRDRQRVAEQAVEPIAWTVHEFVLVHSARGASGRTEHVPLERWTLRG